MFIQPCEIEFILELINLNKCTFLLKTIWKFNIYVGYIDYALETMGAKQTLLRQQWDLFFIITTAKAHRSIKLLRCSNYYLMEPEIVAVFFNIIEYPIALLFSLT